MTFRPGSIGKRDANEREIIDALVAVGCCVKQLHDAGCDLIAARRGWNVTLIEIKDGRKVPSKRKPTPKEKRWILDFGAIGVTLHVVTNVPEALAAVGLGGN
jgi:hypothetical protein